MPSIRQSIRSSTASKRPTSAIADGQIALNTASGTPGMFFKDSAGNIVKAGPAHYGATAPNSSPAVGGSTGNSFGEAWLDVSLTPAGWKIWNGSAWVNATPLSSDTVQGLVELATNAETQAGVDAARAVTAASLQSKVSDSISTTSASGIASSTAVKTAYDLANAALPKSGGIVTGNLEIGSTGSFTFEGATADGFETTLAVVNPTADRTITFPDITGTVVTTGDTGTVTSAMILDGTILNADINTSAAIAFSKLATLSSANILVGNASGVPTSTTVSGDVTITNAGVTAIASNVIVNADINSAAAIAYSKLALASGIVNTDISASAAIAYSKLALSSGITNTDINASAAIAYSKLATLGSANILVGSASGVPTSVAMSGDVTITNAGVTAIASNVIVNADINSAAAIAYSKLALSSGITNTDVSASAAIAYSKLALSSGITNTDINASAAIVDTKLATIATALKVSNSATTATDANTPSAIVARSASGNFTAGTITAALTGAASSNVLKAGDTMTGVLAVTAGTAALPGIAVSGDLNTGLVSPGADQLAITTGGASRLAVSTTAVSSTLAVDHPLGAVGTPSITFTGDLNTGIYSPGADQVAISTNGVARLTTSTTAVSSSLAIDHPLGAVGTPALTFTGDLNTGIYSPGADQVAITTAGVQRVNFNAATEVVFNDGGADVDFRIEGDTNANLFKIDAGLDQVQVANLNGGQLAGTRNRIINGDMRIDQRNAGAAVTVNTSPVFPVDRFYCDANVNGIFTAQRSTTVPVGFTNSLILTVTTPRTSIAASDVYGIRQQVEGFNTAGLGFGSASASAVTLSFWVRSSITGTYTISLFNSAFNRSYVATYSINAANTYEYKTITIDGDTTGTWLTDNGVGISVFWDLGSGSNYHGTAGAWAATGSIRTSGSTNWISTNGATFYITGVQLEPGTVATPFERRSYGAELALCQRYFNRLLNNLPENYIIANGVNLNTTFGCAQVYFPTMRVTPSATIASGSLLYGSDGGTPSGYFLQPRFTHIQFEVTGTSFSVWNSNIISNGSATALNLDLSAEL